MNSYRVLPFSLFPSGKDEAKTASSQKSFLKTTTRRSRTLSTRAGSWPSRAKAARGRRLKPSSTRGRPTSWSAYRGATYWVRGGRLTPFLCPSPCSLSASGLNTPITISAPRDAEDLWLLAGNGRWPSAEEPLQEEKHERWREIYQNTQEPVYFFLHLWIYSNRICKLSNLLVIFRL